MLDLVNEATGGRRFENEKEIMALQSIRPCGDAVRNRIHRAGAGFLRTYGPSRILDSYELPFESRKIPPHRDGRSNYVVVASVEKKYLPPEK